MTAAELDAFLRGQMTRLEAQRPGAARPRYATRWDEARAAFTAAVADKTGVDAAFVADLLERREQLLQAPTHSFEAWRLAADAGFVSAVTAAAAWTAAARPRSTRGGLA